MIANTLLVELTPFPVDSANFFFRVGADLQWLLRRKLQVKQNNFGLVRKDEIK